MSLVFPVGWVKCCAALLIGLVSATAANHLAERAEQVGDGRQTHQEASASQSTNNNDGVTHPDDIPISSNGSDRGGL